MKDLYGSAILFFYFFKWPYVFGFIWLYNHGLDNNIILNILWFWSVLLILKDAVTFFKQKYTQTKGKE